MENGLITYNNGSSNTSRLVSAARSSTPKSALPLPDFFTELQITYTYIPSLFLIFPFPFVFIFTSLYSILFYSIDETTSNAFFLHTPYSILIFHTPDSAAPPKRRLKKLTENPRLVRYRHRPTRVRRSPSEDRRPATGYSLFALHFSSQLSSPL